MSKIEETLRKIAAATSKENSPTSSSIESNGNGNGSAPAAQPVCPICGGIGYYRQDLPVGHPNFGRAVLCSCRQGDLARANRDRLFRLSNLEALHELTFDNFQPRGRGLRDDQAISLELAFNASQQFSGNLHGWLFLQGGYGCGKTHLAAAIANYAVAMGIPTLFLTVPDLLDWMRFAYDSTETTFADRFEEIRNIELLVLDDFGTQNTTPWAQEKLFQIINYRYVNRLAMVITTNIPMELIEERIRSRFSDKSLVNSVKITAPDFRDPTSDADHPELSSLHLHGSRTFESFQMRRGEGLVPEDLKSLEKAYQAALEYAKNPQGWLVLTGNYGCGKTHLAAAIGNYCAALGKPPLFVVVPDLLDHLRATFSPSATATLDRRFDEVRTAPLLILDDLGTQSTTPWAQEKLYQLFNYRYNAEMPTVITTALRIEEVDGRIRSRMMDKRLCKVNAITVPAYYGVTHSEDKKSSTKRTGKYRETY